MSIESILKRSIVESECVWRATGKISYLSNQDIFYLRNYSSGKGLRQFRYCLHEKNEDTLQKMLIFHNRPQVINWHAQLNRPGYVYYICLEGEVEIVVKEKKFVSHRLGTKCSLLSQICLPRDLFRRVITNSSNSIFLEIAEGPFVDSDTIWSVSL